MPDDPHGGRDPQVEIHCSKPLLNKSCVEDIHPLRTYGAFKAILQKQIVNLRNFPDDM